MIKDEDEPYKVMTMTIFVNKKLGGKKTLCVPFP